LIGDAEFARNLDNTMENLEASSKGMNENMEAAKHNILLRGYFKKKKREEEKKKKELEEKKKEELELKKKAGETNKKETSAKNE